METRSWDTGSVLSTIMFPPDAHLSNIHRGDLQTKLLERAQAMDNVDVRVDCRVADIDVHETSVQLASGETLKADLLIVADGVNSRLKWKISPADVTAAEPTGDAAYRIVIPRHLLEGDDRLMELMQDSKARRWGGPHGQIVAYPIKGASFYNMVLVHPDPQSKEDWTHVATKQKVADAYQNWDPVVRVRCDSFLILNRTDPTNPHA